MSELVIVELNGENRIDSRLVAGSLGIKHKAFSETLGKYREDLEELGQLPFQTEVVNGHQGGGNPAKYAMLNEDQAIFASTLSRNTRQVVDFKLALTKAFAQARKKVQEQLPYINADFALRLQLNKGRVPYDHWTVLEQIDKESHHNGLALVSLINKARPDISVGKKWSNYLKKRGDNPSQWMLVPNVVQPDSMRIEDVRAYPLDILPMFLRWLHEEYKEHFVKYYLPPRVLRKELEQKGAH